VLNKPNSINQLIFFWLKNCSDILPEEEKKYIRTTSTSAEYDCKQAYKSYSRFQSDKNYLPLTILIQYFQMSRFSKIPVNKNEK
jgi:hypothetical protein